MLHRSGTLIISGRDGEGRTIGTLRVDGSDINSHLVEEGHAWSARGRNGRGPLLRQERVAKALARGLHAQPGAMMPADYRRLRGPCASQQPAPH